ncbi:MAG: hypothetical protein K9G49_01745 [Taibaiella sp.]|nr:hypothetical protein [Taibaiella sp.]
MKNEIIKILSAVEPQYQQAQEYNKTAIPTLLQLLKGADTTMAAKAVYFAGYMNIPESLTVLKAAAKHPEITVRIACAGAVQFATQLNGALLLKQLLQDTQANVRMVTLKMIRKLPANTLKADIDKLKAAEKDENVKAYMVRSFQ